VAHWISSEPGLGELQRQGLDLYIKDKEDLALILERRQWLARLVNSMGSRDQNSMVSDRNKEGHSRGDASGRAT